MGNPIQRAPHAPVVCVFDAYGTLFDVDAAARAVARKPGREAFAAHWQQVATHWRRKQLQYSWLRAVMAAHVDFWQVTRDGLDWALEAAGLEQDDALREELLQLYWMLPADPDAAAAASYGFRAVWINRRGEPVDRLPEQPQHQLPGLRRVPELAAG